MMIQTLKDRLKKLGKNGNLIDVSYGNDELLPGVVVKAVDHDIIHFFQPATGKIYDIELQQINFFEY